ncbi:hypothetical protein M9Y10_043267 [Tritrichomonas musculus]|uniref:Uncharacterized protein n=1 Tax=Tritrichomonas musculus TaxID=1915356 RepID=A0ABR2JZJ5_9EUKA
MSTEIEQLNVLFEQTQNDFMPPVKIQIDITQMQSILKGMCQQMIRMQNEIDGLKTQLKSKANQNELLNLNSQIHNKIEGVIENNNESVNQINSNMESLKNALIAGLEKCQSDALSVARDLVAEVKPISAQAESRKSSATGSKSNIVMNESQSGFISNPIPTSDLEELTKQLEALSERVVQIEASRDIPSGDLTEKMSELSKRAKDISSSMNSSNQSSAQSPTVDQRMSRTPDLQTTNHLYDLNDAIRTINDRLNQLESGTTDQSTKENQANQEVPDDIYQQLRDQSDQIKKLTEEINLGRTGQSTSQVELSPNDRDVISQLNVRLFEMESNFTDIKSNTKDLNDQVNDQKTQLGEYKQLLEQYKDELKTSIDTALEKTAAFKDLYNIESKQDGKDEGDDNLIDDDDEQADESDNSMDTPRLKPSTPPQSENAREIQKSSPAPINTDELLESFLDVARAEVDKAKMALMDELSSNVRAITSQLAGNISKAQATFDIGLKKTNSLITDQCTQIQTDLKNHSVEQQNTIKDLHIADADINEKIRLIEQRLDSVMKIAKAPPPKIETFVDSKGKLDLGPLVTQIQTQTALCEDLSNRVASLEERDSISPTSFNNVLESIKDHESKLGQLEITTQQVDSSVSNMKDTVDDLKKKQNSPEEEAKFQELKDLTASLDSETKRLCEAMVKFNKDLISCRAAINTLRSHSEETSGSVEDIMKMCEQAREDCASTDKRVKKLIVFIQDENKEMMNQIKDISRSVERNADRIEEIANKKSESGKSTLTYNDEEEEEEEEEDYQTSTSNSQATTPKSGKKTKKQNKNKQENKNDKNSALNNEVKYENIMTSPHVVALPPLEEKKENQNDELLIPKISPHSVQKNQQQQQQQVMQLPAQVVYDQPIVTVVGRNSKMPLPRLAKVPAQLRSSSELTKNDLKKYDDLFGRLDQFESKFNAIKSAVDGLNKQVKTLQDNKAEKDALQALFDQFRLAMGELNNRIGSLRKNIIQKADISELVQVRTDILKEIKIQGETAAGTEPVRCLLCGNPRHSVTGAFDANITTNASININSINPMSIKPTGLSVSSRVSGADGSVCYVYGENGQMYLGRSQDGKPIVLKNLMNDPGHDGNGVPIQGTVPLPDAQ